VVSGNAWGCAKATAAAEAWAEAYGGAHAEAFAEAWSKCECYRSTVKASAQTEAKAMTKPKWIKIYVDAAAEAEATACAEGATHSVVCFSEALCCYSSCDASQHWCIFDLCTCIHITGGPIESIESILIFWL
jgi:hypothetical protein